MEILTFSTIVILAATSAIFGAATLLLGKEIKNLRGQLWSQEAQSHLEEQEYFRAIREAQRRLDFLEMQRPKEKTAKDYDRKEQNGKKLKS